MKQLRPTAGSALRVFALAICAALTLFAGNARAADESAPATVQRTS
jgi:hypothetical protein